MGRSGPEVADVFRRYGDAYREQHGGSLSTAQRRVMTAIEICRTAALGGHVEQCDTCGHQRICYCSCRNRHCPKCQSLARAQWLDDRRAEVLDTQYFHVVFTLPAEMAAIALQNKAVVYGILFRTVAETLRTIAADPKHLGAEIGFFAVLHTWGSNLSHHPHLHVVVPGGGLSPDGNRWISCRAGYFLPVQVLSRLFRRLFTEALEKAFTAGELAFFSALAHLKEPDRLPALPGPGPSGRMGGLCQAPVRRTGAGLGVCRPLYTPCRHLQQSHPRYRGRQGSLPVEGLSSRRPNRNR